MEDKSKNVRSKNDVDAKTASPNSETTPPEGIHLPEPDLENITVLTHSLPNKPILPWNRYDSSWDETEAESDSSLIPDAEDSEATETTDSEATDSEE